MKTSRFFLSVAFLLALPHGSFADQVQSGGVKTFEKGRAAYYRGDLAEARRCFEALLKAKPDFELARIHLAQVAAAERELAKIPRSLKVARSATMERMEWHGGSVEDAIAAAAREIERAGGGRDHWNVPIAGHLPETVRERSINLRVSKLAPDQVLDAIGFAGGVRISYTADGLAVRDATVEGKRAWDAGDPGLPSMEAAARKITLERFVMQDATTADALDYLQRKAVELSGGKLRPVFVIRHDIAPRGGVSLDLRNVSLLEAVRSVCLVSDLEEKWFPWGAGIGNKQAAAAVTSPSVNGAAVK